MNNVSQVVEKLQMIYDQALHFKSIPPGSGRIMRLQRMPNILYTK